MHDARVVVDFNAMAAEDLVRLTCAGTADDLRRLGIDLVNGTALGVYDEDEDGQGASARLIADGVVERHRGFGWVLRIDSRGIRREPRA